MSLLRRADGAYQSTLLSQFDWIVHEFGTARTAQNPQDRILKQIHSALILDASECSPGTEADGIVTEKTGVGIAVKSADCVPVLLADPERRVIAAVHCGWRGTAAGIVSNAVRRLVADFGSRPADLTAAMGPSIGPCCFEVGPEVAAMFGIESAGKINMDLWSVNRRQLQGSGLLENRIDSSPPCTFCGGSEFYSWRRDRVQGQRMFSRIQIVHSR